MLQRLPRSYGQERLFDLLVQIQVKIFKMFLQDGTLQPVLKRRKKSIRRIFPLYFGNHMRDMAGIIREKISAPPITMISGSINSRHSNSPAE